jgi:hypothetical protein
MSREQCVRAVAVAITVASVAFWSPAGRAAEAPMKTGSSILFVDDRARERFEKYRAFLQKDPEKFSAQLAAVARLERSDVQYVIAIVARPAPGVEGSLSCDGERVIVAVVDFGGPGAEVASLNSRFAHELEHARQFDAGELALARDPRTGVWRSHYASYDIGDEVKAWEAQLAASSPQDYWVHRKGVWLPTLLRLFANEKTDAARARVLVQHGYSSVNPVPGCNVRFAATAGYDVGQIVRPGLTGEMNVFGRVFAIEPPARVPAPPADASVSATRN